MGGRTAEGVAFPLELKTAAAALPPTDNEFEHLRLRGGDGRSLEREEEEDSGDEARLPSNQSGGRRGPQRSNGLSNNEFQPGAIVRVKVENFVTYEKAEFFLGPNLNMVIGPNGTGKSSLVCAICLGLGYPSSVLGRASAVGEFVKHGKEEAEIEVELQRKPEDSENYIVGLCIKREDNSRKFTINRSKVFIKDIQQLMRSLRIQIDNLCQFLPQDKVAEFAGLTPVELLEKTLHAAAPAEMIAWQSDLKEHYNAQKEAQRSADASREKLRSMQTRQQVLQADVEKLQERKRIQETIEKLKGLHLVLRYDEARKAYTEVKEHRKTTEQNLKTLQKSSAPSLQAVNRKQEYQEQIQAVVNDRKNALKAAESAADEALTLVDGAENKYNELLSKANAEKETFTTKKNDLGRIRKNITKLETMYKQVPPQFDAADSNRKIREKEHLLREKSDDAAKLAEDMEIVRQEGIEKKHQREKLLRDLESLESQQGQLASQLKGVDAGAARGWEWLRQNQDQFEKEVFGPPMVTCSIRDPRYSDLVQSALQQSDFLCFTAQTRNDHIRLSDQFYSKMKLSVTIRTCLKPLNSFQPPVPRDELAELGFDGYFSDYIEGPEPVLAMLCGEKRLHMSAVGLQPLADDKLERVLQGERINQFACGNQTYRVTRRREYGPSAVTTRIGMLQRGRFWTDQPIDATEKTELQRRVEEATEEIQQLKAKYAEAGARHRTLEGEKQDIVEKISLLRKEKNELQRQYSQWQTLPDKIESEKRSLAQKEAELAAARSRLRESERLQAGAILDKADAVLLHQQRIGSIRTAWHALLEAQILLIEAKSDVAYLAGRNSEIMQQLEAQKVALDNLKREQAEKKSIAAAVFEVVAQLDPEYREELVRASEGRTAQDIDAELSAERAKLDVVQANNPMALEEYETWSRRIAKEEADHAEQESRVADLTDKIDRVRSRWEPRLDALVGEINDAFSYNFEQISCAGEVGVHKEEDFAKWAIEIRVKFRENETLQRLDQHRQSGGERAVSTIFYLMSLQSMAQAPFRVVDEINQGMDPRNERMVHERMVEIACREHTSQYFLITPKLLSGLRYDERMRVHTIVSGEHVDVDGTEKMNFAKFARIQRRVMGR